MMTACTATETDQQHLCAFDSFLHATICSNLHSTTVDAKLQAKLNNRHKMKQLNHSVPTPGLKLKTSVLNQLNPNLTPEQKLNRKLNDVEKWLLERDATNHEAKIRSREADNNKNLLNPVVIDKLAVPAASTPKKVFNKELLLTKKVKQHQSKHQKEAINNTKNQMILEYSNVPVPGDASECENLINMSDEDQPAVQALKKDPQEPTTGESSESTAKSSSVRFVHIHHHFYHFDSEV